MQQLRRILSTLTLISICRFVSPNSPSRHHTISCILMHSHFFTKSPFQPDAVVVLVLSALRSLFLHVCRVVWGDARWRRRFACSALHVLLPGVSGDNKKMDAPGDFFFPLRWITLPLCFQQEAVRLSEGSVGWIAKVNAFFNFSYSTSPFQSFISTVVCDGGEAAPLPSPSD